MAQTKMIIITEPVHWEMTNEKSGDYKAGFSAVCMFPLEGFVQKISNLPGDCLLNTSYNVEIGFKQAVDKNGKQVGQAELKAVVSKSKDIDWAKVL
jgi:hypothetical protein